MRITNRIKGMKRTYQPNKLKRKRKHGFLARKKTSVLKRRLLKKRKRLAV